MPPPLYMKHGKLYYSRMAALGWDVGTIWISLFVVHLVCNTAQYEFELIPLVFLAGVE